MPIAVEELLIKSKEMALLAVETFNRPTAEFRVQAFIMLMHTAWTALLLAQLLRAGAKPYYREPAGRRYQRVRGERKAWGLEDCVAQLWGSRDDPVRQNLRFFIELRDKIEHFRDQAALVKLTFGECQSLVTNFEDCLTAEFGDEHSLAEKLSLALQLSHVRDEAQEEAVLRAMDRATASLREFIVEFRSSLSDEIFGDMRFSHKVFLLPKTANHVSRDALAIEWLDVDALPPEERAAADRLAGIIKRQQVPVQNLGKLKAGEVSDRVREALELDKFSPSHHHVKCWRYFAVRPPKDAADPTATKANYCVWDAAHGDYLYTEAWVEHLIEELRDEERRLEILQAR